MGLKGKTVALQFANPASLITSLISLDGWAGTLLLLPPVLDAAIREGFLRQAFVDFLLSDADGPGLMPSFQKLSGEGDSSGITRSTDSEPTRWVLATSGTTSVPKLVSHSLASLTVSTNRDRSKSLGMVWGLLYEPTRFAGLQVFLQALFGGVTLVLTQGSEELAGQVGRFADHGVNALSATPTLWRKLLMTEGLEKLTLRQVTLGGEIADQSILLALRHAFPTARVIHIYASTEAGVGFSVSDGQAGFPISYLEKAPGGVELRIGQDGLLWLRPTRSRPTAVDQQAVCRDSEGYINTGDRVQITGDRCLFLGRDSGSINVGGNKVMPEEVEAVLLQHPGVALVKVSGLRSSITGQLVVATVQARGSHENPEAFKAELRVHCAARLPAYKVPALIKLVPDLSVSAAGKIVRAS